MSIIGSTFKWLFFNFNSMEKSIEIFLENVSSKEIKEILKEHLSKLIKNDEEKDIVLAINKKYAMNELHKSKDMDTLLHTIHKVYWEEYSLTLKLDLADLGSHEDGEDVFVPHMVRY